VNGKAPLRLFFAVWPEPKLAHRLASWANSAHRTTGGRLTRAESIHLTLAFLGEVPAPRVENAISAALRVPARTCIMQIDEACFWPHNRIVWAGPRETPAPLAELAADLKQQLEVEGFDLDARSFQAHITLIRKARATRQLPPLPALDWRVHEFVLVRSMKDREGARYEVLRRFAA